MEIILNEYHKKVNAEMTKDRKMLQKALKQHEAAIDRIISYQEGVYLSRRVYNWCLGSLTIIAILVWMKII